MKQIKFSHIIISALVPLLLLSLIFCVYQSYKQGEMNLTGILFALYYIIPVVFFTLLYVGIVESLIILNFNSLLVSMLCRIMLALMLGLLVLTMWVLFDGGMYKYDKMGFSQYWLRELKRYWFAIAYFGITIPVILNILLLKAKR
jgi:hypothetical protein